MWSCWSSLSGNSTTIVSIFSVLSSTYHACYDGCVTHLITQDSQRLADIGQRLVRIQRPDFCHVLCRPNWLVNDGSLGGDNVERDVHARERSKDVREEDNLKGRGSRTEG